MEGPSIPPTRSGSLRTYLLPKWISQAHRRPCIAEKDGSGNVFVLVEGFTCGNHLRKGNEDETLDMWFIDDDIGKGSLKGTALLSRPQSGSIYKNIAVAPLLTTDGLLRVAIVWQTEEINYIQSELCVYGLREEAYYEPDRSDNDLATSGPTLQDHPGQANTLCKQPNGRRPHLKQPLRTNFYSRYCTRRPATTSQQGKPGNLLPAEYPVPEMLCLGCCRFKRELHRNSLQHLRFQLRGLTISALAGPYVPNSKMLIHDTYYCACKLHDDGFRIMLPDSINVTTVNATVQNCKPKNSSFFPWKALPPDRQQVDVGSGIHYGPQGRRKVLEREEEWFRERIRGMRRCWLTDFEIAELWGLARWMQWGQVGKPDDRKEL